MDRRPPATPLSFHHAVSVRLCAQLRRFAAAACLSLAAAAPSLAGAAPTPDAELADEWRRLRATPGHFDGAAWNADVDRWDGSKHRVMRELATRLVTRGASAGQALAQLGAPDRVVVGDESAAAPMRQALSHPCPDGRPPLEGDMLWLYRWRGYHDRLVLWLRDEYVAGCGWLHDWE